jgi:hypothetical protein
VRLLFGFLFCFQAWLRAAVADARAACPALSRFVALFALRTPSTVVHLRRPFASHGDPAFAALSADGALQLRRWSFTGEDGAAGDAGDQRPRATQPTPRQESTETSSRRSAGRASSLADQQGFAGEASPQSAPQPASRWAAPSSPRLAQAGPLEALPPAASPASDAEASTARLAFYSHHVIHLLFLSTCFFHIGNGKQQCDARRPPPVLLPTAVYFK